MLLSGFYERFKIWNEQRKLRKAIRKMMEDPFGRAIMNGVLAYELGAYGARLAKNRRNGETTFTEKEKLDERSEGT
jgi:hypothetical protein